MELCFRYASADGIELLAVGSSCQDIARTLCHARKDLGNLFRSLAFRVDHLRHADTQWPVVIDLRESQIFERQMAETCDRFFRRELGVANLLEQLPQCALVHCSGDLRLRV